MENQIPLQPLSSTQSQTVTEKHTSRKLVLFFLILFPPIALFIMFKEKYYHKWLSVLLILNGINNTLLYIYLIFGVFDPIQKLYKESNIYYPSYAIPFAYIFLVVFVAQVIFGMFIFRKYATPYSKKLLLAILLMLFMNWLLPIVHTYFALIKPVYDFTGSVNSTTKTNPPSITSDTTNWKTYTNERYKYSIKYPSDWSTFDGRGSHDPLETIKNTWLAVLKGPKDCEKTIKQCGYIEIAVTELSQTESSKSAKEIWLDDQIKQTDPDIKSEQNIILNGINASKISYIYHLETRQMDKSAEQIPFITVLLLHDNKMYTIRKREFLYPEDKPLNNYYASFSDWRFTPTYNQILSTFKFTKNSAPDFKSEHVVISGKYSFDVQIPDNYSIKKYNDFESLAKDAAMIFDENDIAVLDISTATFGESSPVGSIIIDDVPFIINYFKDVGCLADINPTNWLPGTKPYFNIHVFCDKTGKATDKQLQTYKQIIQSMTFSPALKNVLLGKGQKL